MVTQTPSKVGRKGARAGLPPRSRAGCITCKRKHIKCDEARPECLRCSEKGLKCGGYKQDLKWSFKYQPDFQFQSFSIEPSSPSSSHIRPRKNSTKQQYDVSSTTPTYSKSDTASIFSEEHSNDQAVQGRGPRGGSNIDELNSATPTSAQEVQTREGPPSEEQLSQVDELVFDQDPGPQSTNFADFSLTDFADFADLTDSISLPTGQALTLSTRTLTDNASAFVINWFEQVCPAWSGFDSDANMNRRIAIDLWHNSATVRSSLESMSAGFMASRLPWMRQSALRLMQTATDCIQAELMGVKGSTFPLFVVPTGLLFSLFCMGTTICWVDARALGLPFIKEAKALLRRLNRQISPALEGPEKDILAFFNKSLAYCEMLLAVVHNDDDCQALEDANAGMQPIGAQPAVLGNYELGDTLHPWTGVSTSATSLFTKSMTLCRKFRLKMRTSAIEPEWLFMPICDELAQAESLEEQLLALKLPFDSGSSTFSTGDQTTPVAHLIRTAEAYRLASLLQLYQTFPYLVSLRLPSKPSLMDNEAVLWSEWITPLSLHLVQVLEGIPPTSGSRVIQPLLYISASTGLRRNVSARSATTSSYVFEEGSHISPLDVDAGGSLDDTPSLSSYISQIGQAVGQSSNPNVLADDVGKARQFISERLSILESSLPPTPVAVARELVLATWRAYDNEPDGLYTTHWVDVMEDNNLRSMFG